MDGGNIAEGRLRRAFDLLADGDLKQGFAEYEARWDLPGTALPSFPMPMWRGENLAGRSILVLAEQGFGDTIQFVRYLLPLREKGAHVVFRCPPPLRRLLDEFPGVDEIVASNVLMRTPDFYVPLLSLPRLFGTTIQTIPVSVPYISPPRDLSAVITRPPGTKLAVGLAWSVRRGDDRRAVPAHHLCQLSMPGVALYGLQPDASEADVASIQAFDIGRELTDFARTAAAVASLDLVVSVDTALAHLAGAMARPCFVLLQHNADWRWLRDREDSPWYPTLRLFRQETPGDWAGVVRRVGAAIERLLA